MLVLVTIIGVSMLDMSMIESLILRSEAQFKRNFYMTESAGHEAAQRLENADTTEIDPTASLAWVVPDTSDLTQYNTWRDDQGTPDNYADDQWTVNSITTETLDNSNREAFMAGEHNRDNLRLAAHFRGVSEGSSLKVTGTEGRLYAFNVYGMYSDLEIDQGESLIEMGFKKRF